MNWLLILLGVIVGWTALFVASTFAMAYIIKKIFSDIKEMFDE